MPILTSLKISLEKRIHYGTPLYRFQKFLRACSYSTPWVNYMRTHVSSNFLYSILCVLSAPIGFFNYVRPVSQKAGAKSGLAVVGIVKNEGRYIREWIDFYLASGVDKIILFDNESTDDTAAIINDPAYRGKTDYTFFPGIARQYDAYNIALRKYKNQYKYMAFLDCDEYMYCEGESLGKRIDRLFRPANRERIGGLSVNWLMFGSSGHEDRPVGGVLENYLWRAEDAYHTNRFVKTVVSPTKVLAFASPHYPIYKRGYVGVNEKGDVINSNMSDYVMVDKIRVNHYYTKSREDWTEKVTRGRADIPQKRKLDEFDIDAAERNAVFDDRILHVLEDAEARTFGGK